MTSFRKAVLVVAASVMLAACAGRGPEMETVDYVDLDRFMGDWYVIANIPTFLEKGAHNAVETYAMNDDGTIATTFTFREDGFDGKKKEFNPKGFVRDTESNAVWGMRFVWPIKADYRIIYLDDDYSLTVIGRNKRDYVWLMARDPVLAQDEMDALIARIRELGYPTDELRLIPQRPLGERGD